LTRMTRLILAVVLLLIAFMNLGAQAKQAAKENYY